MTAIAPAGQTDTQAPQPVHSCRSETSRMSRIRVPNGTAGPPDVARDRVRGAQSATARSGVSMSVNCASRAMVAPDVHGHVTLLGIKVLMDRGVGSGEPTIARILPEIRKIAVDEHRGDDDE